MRYIATRIMASVLTLAALSMLAFVLPRLGGDPVVLLLPADATEIDRQALTEELGLDKPVLTQYWIFVKNAARGDFGESVFIRLPVTQLIMERFPNTLKLAGVTALFVIPTGVLLGVLCAARRNKFADWLGRSTAILGQSLPAFWLGIMLIILLSVELGLLPTSGMGGPKTYVMPVITLGFVSLAGLIRLTRSSTLEVLGSDYVAFLRATGITERSIVLKHALRNASISIVTMAAVMFGFMLTGSIVIECVFAWPGMGRLAYESVLRADFPLIEGIVLFYGFIFISMNLLADILYAWLDPRIRY